MNTNIEDIMQNVIRKILLKIRKVFPIKSTELDKVLHSCPGRECILVQFGGGETRDPVGKLLK